MALATAALTFTHAASPERLLEPTCYCSCGFSRKHVLERAILVCGRVRLAGRSCGGSCRVGAGSVRAMAPDEEKMTRRSPLDFPIEWDRPRPGRRPDIFPQFSPMKTPLPQPLPADPPEEDEDEEEKKEEEEENPDNEPEKKPDVSYPL